MRKKFLSCNIVAENSLQLYTAVGHIASSLFNSCSIEVHRVCVLGVAVRPVMAKDSRDTAKTIEDLRRESRKQLREIKDTLHEVKALKEDLRQIIKQNDELNAQNTRMWRRVEEVEQCQRSNNLEIKDVFPDVEPLEAVPTARHDV